MNLPAPVKTVNFLTEELLTSEELYSVGLVWRH
jgi:hypothetical protein